jgi:acetyltransferase-like isoleucine patch superfamily enzyme
MDTDFHPLDPETRRVRPQDAKTAPSLIGNDAFIGMDCLILKGVTIGAGKVITRDVPCNTFGAGNQAQVLGLVK